MLETNRLAGFDTTGAAGVTVSSVCGPTALLAVIWATVGGQLEVCAWGAAAGSAGFGDAASADAVFSGAGAGSVGGGVAAPLMSGFAGAIWGGIWFAAAPEPSGVGVMAISRGGAAGVAASATGAGARS